MNKKFLLLIASVGFLFSACQKDSGNSSYTSKSSSFAPSVAIAPVIDHSESGLNWDLSDEITYSLSTRLVQKTRLNVADPQKTRMQIKKNRSTTVNPFGSDLKWVKTTFPGEDFVVFMEIIEHRELPRGDASKSPESLPADLNLALRLRIVDARKDQPSIVLQEIIQDSHFIPTQFNRHNFHQAPWNSEEFSITPVGIAHSLLIKEITSRIDDYISLSKS